MYILGLDPGLRKTGWGVIFYGQGGVLRHIANGTIRPPAEGSLGDRLAQLHDDVEAIIKEYAPATGAVEETFVNQNPKTTLLLGQARGVVLMTIAVNNIPLSEYSPNKIKKTVVGSGHAGKAQMMAMVKMLLPGVEFDSEDAADALAIAICHAQHYTLWHQS